MTPRGASNIPTDDTDPFLLWVDTGNIIQKAVERRLQAFGLGSAQQRILALLQSSGPLTPSILGALILQETHSISGLLNRLEDERHLITRTRDRKDRRVVWVSLTPEGEQLAMESTRTVNEVLSAFEALLPESARPLSADLANKLLRAAMPTAGFDESSRNDAFTRARIADRIPS
jgi:DNA-binding MarR family transcriptional regulator